MCKSLDLRQSAPQAPGDAPSGQPRSSPTGKPGFFAIVRAEFRRALAAERRYEKLKYGRHENPAPSGIARKVFDEFYADDRSRFRTVELRLTGAATSRGLPRRRGRRAAADR